MGIIGKTFTSELMNELILEMILNRLLLAQIRIREEKEAQK